MVTIFTKNSCNPCRLTKRAMDSAGISYVERNVDLDPQALTEALESGFTSSPVVVTDTTSWSGFRPDNIKALQRELALATA